jgi:hypothetical protein
MADFSKIFEQAQQMQTRMKEMQAELEKQTVTAAAGGGLVTVEADGDNHPGQDRSERGGSQGHRDAGGSGARRGQ